MNLYRVCFHTHFGTTFQTKIEAYNLEDAREKLSENAISENKYVFDNPNNPSENSFVVNASQVFYIEFELIESLKEDSEEVEKAFATEFELFSFGQFVNLSDEEIRLVLYHINDDELLAKALKKAEAEVGLKFFDNMDRNRKLSLTVFDEKLGNVSKLESEKAQREISHIALQLGAEGEIVLK